MLIGSSAYLIGTLVAVVGVVLLSLFIYLRNPNVIVNKLYLFYSLLGTGWIIANYLGGNTSVSYITGLLANRLTFLFGIGSIVVMSAFAYYLVKYKVIRKVYLYSFYLVNILTILISTSPLVVLDVYKQSDTLKINTGSLYYLYEAVLLIDFVVVFLILFSARRLKNSNLRIQARAVTVSFTIFLSGILVTNVFLPTIFNNYKWTVLGSFLPIIVVLGMSYAITRHKLFDIKLIVAKSIAYSLSLLTIVSIFVFLTFILTSSVFDILFPEKNFIRIAYSILAIAIAFAFQPLKKIFDKATNKFFFHDAYDPQLFLDKFNKIIVSTFELEPLIKRVSLLIEETLGSSSVTFLINENITNQKLFSTNSMLTIIDDDIYKIRTSLFNIRQKIIVSDDIEESQVKTKYLLADKNIAVSAKLSLSNKEEGIGYFFLGNKKSGNIYNLQDIKTLEIINNELVVALQNSLHTVEIENFNITLQDRIKQATNRLRKTNEKLKALDEAKDDFVSMASHQLRTPLTSVKGNISLVLDGDAGKITDLQRQLLEQAFTSSQRMVFLIADLLNVSRLKTGKFVIERSAVDLADIVEEEVNQLVDTAKSRHLTLTYEKPEDISLLMIDETKTRQVIMNFVDNAIYYTPAGGKIDVVLSETPSSVECRVIDNGIGVPLRERPHLFTKFYRADNARKARPDGTGLGLFMAKKVIVAEGGAIIFDSEEGKGSTFGFSFPKSQLAVDSFVPDEANDQTAAVSVN